MSDKIEIENTAESIRHGADVGAGIKVRKRVRVGFLPIETNWFDRLFISVVCWVAISLFWLRFIEPLGASVWISTVLSGLLGFFIIRKG